MMSDTTTTRWMQEDGLLDEPGGREQPMRTLILRTATELMALKGTSATTIRDISLAAKQNVAAVNYYFGSKDMLVRAVLYTALAPVNRARIQALDAFEAAAAPDVPPTDRVLDALLRPLVEADRADDGGRTIVRLLQHIRAIPLDPINTWLSQQFDGVVGRFVDALARANPGLPRAEVVWRYEFVRGAAMHILADLDPRSGRLATISGGVCDINDDEAVLARLVHFGVQGFRA